MLYLLKQAIMLNLIDQLEGIGHWSHLTAVLFQYLSMNQSCLRCKCLLFCLKITDIFSRPNQLISQCFVKVHYRWLYEQILQCLYWFRELYLPTVLILLLHWYWIREQCQLIIFKLPHFEQEYQYKAYLLPLCFKTVGLQEEYINCLQMKGY